MRLHPQDIEAPESLTEWLIQHGEPNAELANDVLFIVDARQNAFRQANAFPTGTRYSYAQQREIIHDLPSVEEVGALPTRLRAVTELGMLSLDLMRADLHGNWHGSNDLDSRAHNFLSALQRSTFLQREIGARTLTLSGYISKEVTLARPQSSVSSLGEEADKHGIFHVIRSRKVAKLLTDEDTSVTINKRSDFLLSIDPKRPEGTALAAHALAHAEYIGDLGLRHGMDEEQVEQLFTQIRGGFHIMMEHAICRRPEWLYPVTVNYYAKAKSDK